MRNFIVFILLLLIVNCDLVDSESKNENSNVTYEVSYYLTETPFNNATLRREYYTCTESYPEEIFRSESWKPQRSENENEIILMSYPNDRGCEQYVTLGVASENYSSTNYSFVSSKLEGERCNASDTLEFKLFGNYDVEIAHNWSSMDFTYTISDFCYSDILMDFKNNTLHQLDTTRKWEVTEQQSACHTVNYLLKNGSEYNVSLNYSSEAITLTNTLTYQDETCIYNKRINVITGKSTACQIENTNYSDWRSCVKNIYNAFNE